MRLSFLGTLLALGLVTGCGGNSDSDSGDAATPQPTAGTTAPVIENPASASAAVAVAKEYLNAFIGGRAERVCALETPAFIARQIESAIATKFVRKGASCVEFVDAAVATARKANPSPGTSRAFEVSVLTANDRVVTVLVDYPQSPGTNSDSYVLVKSGGHWLVDSNP